MRLVDRPVKRPMHCAALPNRGQTAEGERWVDTGAEMPGFDNHVYLSETAVREAGRLLGFPTPADFEGLDLEADRLYNENEELKARIMQLEAVISASEVIALFIEPDREPELEKLLEGTNGGS